MLIVFCCVLLTPIAHSAPITGNDLAEVKILVGQFNSVPAEHMFCSARGASGQIWERGGDPERVLPELTKYFSAEMLRLFKWVQCQLPAYPDSTMHGGLDYYWDFRYGLSQTDSSYAPSRAEKVRALAPHGQRNTKILVKVLFVYAGHPCESTYTLIKESGHWKIDDIALKGYSTEVEVFLPDTKSLKTELQAAYKRAEAKCLQDPKCKTKMGK